MGTAPGVSEAAPRFGSSIAVSWTAPAKGAGTTRTNYTSSARHSAGSACSSCRQPTPRRSTSSKKDVSGPGWMREIASASASRRSTATRRWLVRSSSSSSTGKAGSQGRPRLRRHRHEPSSSTSRGHSLARDRVELRSGFMGEWRTSRPSSCSAVRSRVIVPTTGRPPERVLTARRSRGGRPSICSAVRAWAAQRPS